MGFLDSMNTGAGPKRPAPEGVPGSSTGGSASPEKKQKGQKKGNKMKTALKGTKTSLAAVRILAAENRTSTIFEKGDAKVEKFKISSKAFQDNKPKERIPHPWGHPRQLVMATAAEISLEIFTNNAEVLTKAKHVFGEKPVLDAMTGIAKMLELTQTEGLSIWGPLLSYGKARETRAGDMLLELTGKRGKFNTNAAEQSGLLGIDIIYLLDMLNFTYREFNVDGPAPRGTLERQIDKMLKGLSIDDDDDLDDF